MKVDVLQCKMVSGQKAQNPYHYLVFREDIKEYVSLIINSYKNNVSVPLEAICFLIIASLHLPITNHISHVV